jgi:hypothetical protein
MEVRAINYRSSTLNEEKNGFVQESMKRSIERL